ncbi:hypothetical protein I6F09_04915 [Bradyrhizobium sp. IC3195]|uniref:hypothetical protein n=1 Tax=Bradyrhizobium sp. IC3195 TaxID=2793804 RepID=UPI001CD4E383|nr:hypothetical protein [Bradyrhizobium sp. IC3195]MCA1467228.1 hypothetical protein [Bradyrhizobium sp. IC3195]
MKQDNPSPLEFFSKLRWLDGRDLLDTMEDYRRELHMQALYTFRDDGSPLYNFVLSGRAKKNWKTTDLVLAAFYRNLVWHSLHNNDCYILANDEGQAGDDLTIAKKLVEANPIIKRDVSVLVKGIKRKDGAGAIMILPAGDPTGAHGKTASFIGFDEIHGYKTHDLFEALAPDPTRQDTMTWITSYDTIYNSPGVPLYDFKQAGKAGTDPRMLFSWYSGEYCTDPRFAELPSDERANPSMGSWPEGPAYLAQQRRRLPSHKFRRLHLNLPGAPDGAFLDNDIVLNSTISGLRRIPYEPGRNYVAFVDMSGGSSDDAVLAIAHKEGRYRRLDVCISQDGKPPFNPRDAVRKFVRTLVDYKIDEVTGDNYAGLTFKSDFEIAGISYRSSDKNKTEIYEAFEPHLNGGDVELLDLPKLQEQLLTLVVRGAKIDHRPGDHDDWANAAAGAIALANDEKAYHVRKWDEVERRQHREMADPLAEF